MAQSMSQSSPTAKVTSAALKNLALRELLREREEFGCVRATSVLSIARRLGYSERQVWRWVKQGEIHQRETVRYEIDSDAVEKMYLTRGNMANAARRLKRENPDGPSVRTLRRAMARDVTRAERAAMRTGAEGQRNNQLYMRHEAEHRNEIWEADHKELSLRVKYQGEIVSPWATIFMDSKSRAIPGAVLTPDRPTADDVLSGLLVSFCTTEDDPIGGIPLVTRWDNDPTFTADRITEFLATLGCQAWPVDPYTPTHKGKIERFNRTVEDQFSSCQPGWVHGPREANGQLYDREDVLLEWDELVELFDAFILAYNTEHEHSSLHGRTPLSIWTADEEPIRTVEREELLKSLPGEDRKIGKDGIRYATETYFAPEMEAHFGEWTVVRALPYDKRRIEVYIDDEWICSAVPPSRVSDEDTERFFQERGRRTARINQTLRALGGSDEVVGAPTNKEVVLRDPTDTEIRAGNEAAVAFLDGLRKEAA